MNSSSPDNEHDRRSYNVSVRNLWVAIIALCITIVASIVNNYLQYLSIESQNRNFRETITKQRDHFTTQQTRQNLEFSTNLSLQLQQLEQQKKILERSLQHAEDERKKIWLFERRVRLKDRLYKSRIKYSEFFKIFNFVLSKLETDNPVSQTATDYAVLEDLKKELSLQWGRLINDSTYIDNKSMEECAVLADRFNEIETYAHAADIYLSDIEKTKDLTERRNIINRLKQHLYLKEETPSED